MRSISLIHPARHRPHQALATRLKWMNNAAEPCNIEYLFSMDTDDDTMPSNVEGLRSPNKSAIEAINRAAETANGDILIVVSDDTDCPPHWDSLLLAEIGDRTDFVMKTRDGLQKTLVTMPVMDRVWYERYGYVYNPEYLHMAADVELTAVAIMTGRLVRSDLMFRHLHYSAGLSPKDAVNEKNDTTYSQGNEVLIRHHAVNFGIEFPVCSYESIVW